MSPRKNPFRFLLPLVLVLMGWSLYTHFQAEDERLVGDVHMHADFKVILHGEAYNFTQEKYMSTEARPLSPFTHLHDMVGEVIHKHMSGITLGDFFESLGMSFTKTCFTLDDGTAYCNDETNSLKLFVNDKLNTKFDQYELEDLDRILITYGSESEEELEVQLKTVSDAACIYSETCPERGSPPPESSCTGSEGACLPGQPHTHHEESEQK